MNLIEERKVYAQRRIKEIGLDLSGLNIFTEWADGEYSYVPMIMAMAGADWIKCYSNPIGSVDVEKLNSFRKYLSKNAKIYLTCCNDSLKDYDIIMNLGKIRPINKEMIDQMKPTAVIPMMMMPSERRKEDVDFDACEERGILPIFLDEESCGILDSVGLKILKLLFEAGLSGWHERYLLVSSGVIGKKIFDFLNRLPLTDVSIYQNDVLYNWDYFDAIILADYFDENKFVMMEQRNPFLRIINVIGDFDYDGYKKAGLMVYPDIRPIKGHSAVGGEYLSFKILSDIILLSLKAAEVAVRCRLAGKSIEETKFEVIKNSPGIF